MKTRIDLFPSSYCNLNVKNACSQDDRNRINTVKNIRHRQVRSSQEYFVQKFISGRKQITLVDYHKIFPIFYKLGRQHTALA